ncbi:hypothetical protein KR018_005196 [Drosophila ironensis]|nr:hypothetical protein KR018_005196 [Drosophila ironensis]
MVSSVQILLVALMGFSAVNASPTGNNTSVVDQPGSAEFSAAITSFLEAFRKSMPCGDSNMPALAPLVTPFYAFEHNSEDYTVVGNVTNMRVEGLDGFQVLSSSDYGKTGLAAYDLLFPKIQLLGFSQMEGHINIGGLRVPFRENIVVNEALIDLRFVGSYRFANSLSNPAGLRLVDFQQAVYLADVRMDNWNTLASIASNNFGNHLMQALVPLALEQMQPQITDFLYKNYLVPKINNFLGYVNMEELVNIIQDLTDHFQQIKC